MTFTFDVNLRLILTYFLVSEQEKFCGKSRIEIQIFYFSFYSYQLFRPLLLFSTYLLAMH